MTRASLSIIGLMSYDEGLFDSLRLPMALEKGTAISYIVMRCAEFELLYPEAHTMKHLINVWSEANSERWEKIYRTTVLEYDPISNYDRNEEWTDSGTSTDAVNNTGSSQENHWGFNSDDSVPASKTDVTSRTTNEGKVVNKHTGRVHGNVGVTTTQALIQEERKVLEFNMYNMIADEFAEQFTLMVY